MKPDADIPGEITASQLLRLEQVDTDLFRNRFSQNNQVGTMFGGQMIAQSLAAARRTADGRAPHSLTGYFHRPGTPERPLEFLVERVRDGSRYAARRVLVKQAGKVLFDMLCSFQAPEEGMDHQFAEMNDVPPPEELVTEREFLAANPDLMPPFIAELYARPFPIEIRPIGPERRFSGILDEPRMDTWMRFASAEAVEDIAEHAMLVAFMSDFRFGPVTSSVHVAPGAAGKLFLTSLSHGIVFHEPARADEWLLHRIESPWAGSGRGLARGQLFNRRGNLVASTQQEVVLRRR